MTDDSIFTPAVVPVEKATVTLALSDEVLFDPPMGPDDGKRTLVRTWYYPASEWAPHEKVDEYQANHPVLADLDVERSAVVVEASMESLLYPEEELGSDTSRIAALPIRALNVTWTWTVPPEERRPPETDSMTSAEYMEHLMRQGLARLGSS